MNGQNGNHTLSEGARKLLSILHAPERGEYDHLSDDELHAMVAEGVDTRGVEFNINAMHIDACDICKARAKRLGTFSIEFFLPEESDDE